MRRFLNRMSQFRVVSLIWIGLFCFPTLVIAQAKGINNLRHLKVMTYNIHHANPPAYPGLINIDTLAQIINREKPDLIALQEVDDGVSRSGGVNQALVLAHRTGMNYRFFKAIDYGGGAYGIAILSKLPIISANQISLPQAVKAEARTMAYVEVAIGKNQHLIFANTHLDARASDENRKLQMQAIIAHLGPKPWPVILAGDFNDVPRSNTLDLFDAQFERAGEPVTSEHFGLTFPQDNPDRTLDYIGLKYPDKPNKKIKSLVLTEFSILPETYASDHLPVLVNYRIR